MGADARETAIYALVEDSDAIPDTIQIVREKHQGDEAVVAATFRKSSGRLVRGFVGLHRRNAFWHAGGGWSGAPRDVPVDAIWECSGSWWSSRERTVPPGTEDALPTEASETERGVSGGWVNERTAVALRVTDPNGRVEEDAIEAGVAVLIWEGHFDFARATAELLDEGGHVLRTGPMRRRH